MGRQIGKREGLGSVHDRLRERPVCENLSAALGDWYAEHTTNCLFTSTVQENFTQVRARRCPAHDTSMCEPQKPILYKRGTRVIVRPYKTASEAFWSHLPHLNLSQTARKSEADSRQDVV